MEIHTSFRGDITIVDIQGRIVDGEAAEDFHKELRGLIGEKRSDTIFDLSGVEWFDSVAIGILVSHYISAKRLGGKIVLLKANEKIKKLMHMVKLEDRFRWAEEMDEALKILEKTRG
jgi:anti-anti-sigma factor